VKTVNDEIPNIADLVANHFNQDKTLYESAADLGAIVFEMDRERINHGQYTKHMEELTQLAALQERIIRRMLDDSIEKSDQPKRRHLTVVK
jgi:hypothetical protein